MGSESPVFQYTPNAVIRLDLTGRGWWPARLPLPNRLAQGGDGFGRQGDPAWAMGMLLDRVQLSRQTPVGDRTHIHIEDLGSRTRRVAPIPSLSARTCPR